MRFGVPNHKLTILYKSGAKVHVRADNFEVKKQGGTLTETNWVNLKPRPLYFGVDEVAAIYQGHV